MFRIICLIVGYLIGCIQTAYIVGRVTANIDIREHGSGNAGTTNIIRIIGRSAGLLVFVGDVTKTILAYTICTYIFSSTANSAHVSALIPGFYAGIGVIFGHNYPFYLKFKGGKGAAASVALLLCVDPVAALISYVIGTLVIILSRYISLASLIVTFLTPVLLYMFHHSPETVALGAVVTIMAFIRHRENIVRLLNGTERKFSLSGIKKKD